MPISQSRSAPGGVVAQREMQDSLRIRNRIFISEDDSHTHISEPLYQRSMMGLYTAQDSVNTLKREFARDLCEDIGGWWFDMSSEGKTPWYDDPDILALFRRQQEIGRLAYSLDRTKKNEIALLYDTESVHLVSDVTDRLVLDHYRTSDLHRIGAPVDYYYHNDVSWSEMPDYRLNIVLNAYCLTDADREAIFSKARKNHAVVLWLYAAGFADPDAERIMDPSNIEKTVGMKVEMMNRTVFPYFRTEDNGHPALRYADRDRRYGFIDREVHSTVWPKPTELPVPYMNPGFYIHDESVTVLGRYCIDGRIAYALRETMALSVLTARHRPQGGRGTVTRYGNGVEIYGGCDGYRVENCVYSIEYFLEKTEPDTSCMTDIEIDRNLLRFSGFGWGQQRHNTDTPAHIKGWNYENTARNFRIHDNLFDRAAYRMLHLAVKEPESLPEMSRNVYVQHVGATLGQCGSNRNGEPAMLIFDDQADERIARILKDAGADTYGIKPET